MKIKKFNQLDEISEMIKSVNEESIEKFEDRHIEMLFDIVKRLESSIRRIEKKIDDNTRFYH